MIFMDHVFSCIKYFRCYNIRTFQGGLFMYMTSLERMWGYLHDDKRCVQEYLFVLDIYRYTSYFVDLISQNPEVLPQLRDRIKREKMNSGFLGLLFRDG